jgi:HK97 family phage major capsid protein
MNTSPKNYLADPNKPAGKKIDRSAMKVGMFLKKEAQLTQDALFEKLHKELGDVTAMMAKSKLDSETQYRDLNTHFTGVKSDSETLKKTVEKHVADYAEMVAKNQALEEGLNLLKKEMEAPVFKGGKDLEEADKLAAVELQRRVHLHRGGLEDAFKPDMSNLVKAADYRSAMRKFGMAGVETKERVIASLTADERKAFDASSMDGAFFMPEMLGFTLDCNIECAYMLDLYQRVTVSRSNFMYPHVIDYGSIGAYGCDASCDADLGVEGNISFKNGQVYSFRGVFCLQKKVIQEANYDILGFMISAAQRTKRINDNRVMISGTGVNEPKGWATQDCFTKLKTPTSAFTHQDFRRFLSTAPVERGDIVAVMHQNLFAYLASAVDNNGRFIFGDGDITFSPNMSAERLRISNCLPDPTANNTLGSVAAPFVAGSLLVAAGNWKDAFTIAEKSPLTFELYVGGSSRWCSKWQFDSHMAGFVTCCEAARTLVAGP